MLMPRSNSWHTGNISCIWQAPLGSCTLPPLPVPEVLGKEASLEHRAEPTARAQRRLDRLTYTELQGFVAAGSSVKSSRTTQILKIASVVLSGCRSLAVQPDVRKQLEGGLRHTWPSKPRAEMQDTSRCMSRHRRSNAALASI